MNYGRLTKAELIRHAESQDARAQEMQDRVNDLLRDVRDLESEARELESRAITGLYGLGATEYHALKDFAESQSERWFSEFLVDLADAAWSADGVTLVKG